MGNKGGTMKIIMKKLIIQSLREKLNNKDIEEKEDQGGNENETGIIMKVGQKQQESHKWRKKDHLKGWW